jgi:hypothetical protein
LNESNIIEKNKNLYIRYHLVALWANPNPTPKLAMSVKNGWIISINNGLLLL